MFETSSSSKPNVFDALIPPSLHETSLGLEFWQWLGLAVAVGIAVVGGRALAYLASRVLGGLTRRTRVSWDDDLVQSMRGPSRWLFAVVTYRVAVAFLDLSESAANAANRVLVSIGIVAAAWSAGKVVGVLSRMLERRAARQASAEGAGIDVALRTRGLTTQVRILRRLVNVAIGLLAAAVLLMQFEVVRNIGVSLLASAGLAGVVLGFAAQRTIGTLIAGIQLSMTQPIRIGDVVIVEKEWGVIEEITLTYVVVRIWDERRLIVPMSRFLEQPFENWTKSSATLHGTVFLEVDWTVPLDGLRARLEEIVRENPRWDGRTQNVQVTGSKERTLEVRALVSAANSDALWHLRVDVREKLIRWIVEQEGGRYLPRLRATAEVQDRGPHATERTSREHAVA